jgi:hypothetical protein
MWEKETPIEQHISNMQTILQLYVGDEMSGPALKINILCDMAYSIPYLVPISSRNRFQEIYFASVCYSRTP